MTDEELNRRRHAIFAAAMPLFLEKGFEETSMRAIAAAAGMGKSSLYDYFKTKEEILLYFFEDQIIELTEAAQRIALQNIAADERLRQVMKTHLEFLQANRSLFMKLSLEAQRLKLESQKQIQKKRHAYQDLLRGLIEEGIREGAFRKIQQFGGTGPALLNAPHWMRFVHVTGLPGKWVAGRAVDVRGDVATTRLIRTTWDALLPVVPLIRDACTRPVVVQGVFDSSDCWERISLDLQWNAEIAHIAVDVMASGMEGQDAKLVEHILRAIAGLAFTECPRCGLTRRREDRYCAACGETLRPVS